MFRKIIHLVLVIDILMWCTSADASDWRAWLRVQVAGEYDTNALRIHTSGTDTVCRDRLDIQSDFLTRMMIQGDVYYRNRAHYLQMNYTGGAKLFFHETSEHLLATHIHGLYHYRLAKNHSLGVRVTLIDETQAEHSRDYFLADPGLVLRLCLTSFFVLEPFICMRYFYFKPDSKQDDLKFSHFGPCMGISLELSRARWFRFWLSYGFDVRFFDCLVRKDPDDDVRTNDKRCDMRHTAGLQARVQTKWWKQNRFIAQGSYFAFINQSNSFGSTAVWHRLRLVLTFQLPRDFTLLLMGTLQFTVYPDGLYVDQTSYEPDADENENSAVVRFTYRVWRNLCLFVQGAFYRNDFSSSEITIPPFSRKTVTLGIAYDWSF